MDEELKELAVLALRNAYWKDFSALVNLYLKAAEGLDVKTLKVLMGEMTKVMCRDNKAEAGELDIWADYGRTGSQRYKTLKEALEDASANRVWLRGRVMFERKNGEWVVAY